MRVTYLDIDISGLRCEIIFNGFPVADSRHGSFKGTVQLNDKVVTGPNTVTVQMLTGWDPVQDRKLADLPPDAVFDVRLCESVDQRFPGVGPFQELARIDPLIPDRLPKLPTQRYGTVQLRSGNLPWLWERADRLKFDNELIDSAFVFVQGTRDLLAAGKLDEFIQVGQTVFGEVAPAYEHTPIEGQNSFRKTMQDRMAKEDFGVAPLDRNDFRCHLIGRESLLSVTTGRGDPILRSATFDQRGGGWFVPMIIGKIDGQWKWLR